MSTYSPHPDDLEEPPIREDWRRIADRVLPGNREQLAEAAARRGVLPQLGELVTQGSAIASFGAINDWLEREHQATRLRAIGGDPTGLSSTQIQETYERIARGEEEHHIWTPAIDWASWAAIGFDPGHPAGDRTFVITTASDKDSDWFRRATTR